MLNLDVMLIAKVMRDLEPIYEGNRVVWSPNSKKTKVISLPRDFACEGERLHIWRIDEHTIIVTKLPVFEFVKKVVSSLEGCSDRTD